MNSGKWGVRPELVQILQILEGSPFSCKCNGMLIVGFVSLLFSDVFININVAQLKKVATLILIIYNFVESSLKPHKNLSISAFLQ